MGKTPLQAIQLGGKPAEIYALWLKGQDREAVLPVMQISSSSHHENQV